MGYISYFDLLGTRGFKEGDHGYEENISAFYSEIRKGGTYLRGVGEIGLFSDSVYVFSRDLERLLLYLIYLRESLCAKGLFFNAVVSKGELSSHNPQMWNIPEVKVYGVGFTDKSIIDLYLEQTTFKGIGIKINQKLIEEIEKLGTFKISNSFYYTSSYELELYSDISYDTKDILYENKIKSILTSVIKSALKAYSVNISCGKYYTSILSTILDSYDCTQINWSWDTDKKLFTSLPEIFNIIISIATGDYDECRNWVGIDALCLKIIDMIISSEKVNDSELKDIVGTFISYEYLKKYINSLNNVPNVFSSSSNRKKFIECVQDYIAYDLVTKLINNT